MWLIWLILGFILMAFAIRPFVYWKIWKSTTIIFAILSSVCIRIFGWERWYINLLSPAILISISIFISMYLQNFFLDRKVKKKLEEMRSNRIKYVGKRFKFDKNGQQGSFYINNINKNGTYNIDIIYSDGFTETLNVTADQVDEFVKD